MTETRANQHKFLVFFYFNRAAAEDPPGGQRTPAAARADEMKSRCLLTSLAGRTSVLICPEVSLRANHVKRNPAVFTNGARERSAHVGQEEAIRRR